MPDGVAIVIVDSGVERALSASAYNERRAACERAVAAIRQLGSRGARAARRRRGHAAARAAGAWTTRRSGARLTWWRRSRGRTGSRRRSSAATCAEAGRLMVESHASLRDLYEVSRAELDLLVTLAIGQAGCQAPA